MNRLSVWIKTSRHAVEPIWSIHVVLDVLLASPNDFHRAVNVLRDLNRAGDSVNLQPAAKATADEMIVDRDFVQRQPSDFRRRLLSARDDLAAYPNFTAILLNMDRAVHRLQCRVREKRNLVDRFDSGSGARHGLVGIANVLRDRPRIERRLLELSRDVLRVELRVHIYAVAPNDGTVLGIIPAAVSLAPLTGTTSTRFDPLKFNWIGTPTIFTDVCIAMARAPVKTFHDLLANELIVGAAGVGGGPYIYPRALNRLLGTKFKLVSGFPSAANVLLAMERNEIDGVCQSFENLISSRPEWIATKAVNVLFQGGVRPNPRLHRVPSIADLARTAEEKQTIEFLYAGNGLGRPFIAPPEVPAERVKMLRDAFVATMADPQFLADAQRQRFDVAPESGERLAALIRTIYGTPKSIVDRVPTLIK